ncbi:MAG: heavy metal translocating P-type ATPase, partial [Thermomicrobiales bacterium]
AGLVTAVAGAVTRAGYEATPRAAGQRLPARRPWWRERKLLPTASGTILWVLAFVLSLLDASAIVVDVVYATAMVVAGWAFARAGLQAIRTRRLDMNVLMTVSAIGAAALGDWSEGAMVIVLFALGGTLQALTIDRTRGAIRALMELAPDEAVRLHDGAEVVVPVAALRAGDLIRVKPGARVPADGRIVAGASAVDQSAITGESMPVDKAAGDGVLSGTVNGPGALTVEVEREATDSTLARIIHLVEEAQGSRAPSQALVDRFAAIYTPVVIAGAAALAIVGSLVSDPDTWIYRALVLLVIACPCALVISTPVSIVSAIGAATRRGVLIKGGAALEAAGRARVVAFDKTGTLTRGRPAVTDVVASDDFTIREVLRLASGVEALSEHPLARSVVAWALHEGIAVPTAADFTATAGRGAEAIVEGRRVLVGSPRWFAARAIVADASPNGHRGVLDAAERMASAGQTPLLVGVVDQNGAVGLAGAIAVADTTRPNAAAALAALRAAGIERIAVLTGDNRATGNALAGEVGADEVRAELLPAEKASAVADLRARYGPVAMIGDGVNDAPALASADVGIAMGGAGTDVALETADLVLMRDDLGSVADAISLARRTERVIRQNISLSLAIKVLALVLGAFGVVNLWTAVAADMGTSLLVTFNGLRLARGRRL